MALVFAALFFQVKYARSEIHLSELVDAVCEEFENYVQAREKTGDRAVTIVRITTKSGSMNPLFGSVDIVPDEDLNKRLKFYVRNSRPKQRFNGKFVTIGSFAVRIPRREVRR